MTILVTGSAGFIGFHLCQKLLKEEKPLIGFDNFNSYYDVNLKRKRLFELNKLAKKSGNNHVFLEGDLIDKKFLSNLFDKFCNIQFGQKRI